jgi:hypothetical protein
MMNPGPEDQTLGCPLKGLYHNTYEPENSEERSQETEELNVASLLQLYLFFG